MPPSKKTAKQRLDDAILEMAEGLYNIDAIDAITMREFKHMAFPTVRDLSAREIKNIRLTAKVSQAVFAMLLNVSVHSIHEWEQGKKHPRGSALKLLNLVAEKGLGILSYGKTGS